MAIWPFSSKTHSFTVVIQGKSLKNASHCWESSLVHLVGKFNLMTYLIRGLHTIRKLDHVDESLDESLQACLGV